ncbi:pyridoxamine 5'-phosphate oxidase family protein [Streptomyces sp. H10-C2]|uniref:pyridoxamine 5'-phosphate oxidase family protein n=1 Tax=unclassified Streptomyces TaxID=2593676 RepID=UPI0024BA2189|nr:MULTISPECIES: pyridoxamine 5'-phosphate oxidase family protein [unclassified Streptomyces]MDJ0343378.1 pyridoxamine 5'-phosphate oxidase family protein [Streptomyces sp. PH10-H1]MDJ0371811.1 pyridoxamine 5'-phosphate oxidase family protein [Streptomyces sp. H10-C2]
MTASAGFHEGELSVQQRAGVRNLAGRLSGMLEPPDLTGGARWFLGDRDLAVLTARDRDGRLWTSPLPGTPGFLDAHDVDDATLHVHAMPAPGDPLALLPPGQPVGMLAIDFATRRRMRVNGTLATVDDSGFQVAVDQAYGNCPQYIHRRRLRHSAAPVSTDAPATRWHDSLDADLIRLIEGTDTFFLGTVHPTRGADASHRGGPPGFVRVQGTDLWWPDYPGNNMFNSLGNLAVDDTAALLFLDFATGATLQLSGTAALEWTAPGAPGDDDGTGRRVRFTPRHILTGTAPLRAN